MSNKDEFGKDPILSNLIHHYAAAEFSYNLITSGNWPKEPQMRPNTMDNRTTVAQLIKKLQALEDQQAPIFMKDAEYGDYRFFNIRTTDRYDEYSEKGYMIEGEF